MLTFLFSAGTSVLFKRLPMPKTLNSIVTDIYKTRHDTLTKNILMDLNYILGLISDRSERQKCFSFIIVYQLNYEIIIRTGLLKSMSVIKCDVLIYSYNQIHLQWITSGFCKNVGPKQLTTCHTNSAKVDKYWSH